MKIGLKLNNRHFMSLAGNIIISVMNLVAMMLLTRLLPVGVFGIWVFFQSISILVDSIRSGLLTTGFIKFYSGVTDERAAEIEGSTWYLAILTSGVITVFNFFALLLLPYIANEGLNFTIRWFSLSFWVGLPFYMTSCVLQATQRFDRLLVIRFISQSLFIISILILAYLNKLTLTWLIITFSSSFGISSIFSIAIGWIKISTLKKRTANTIKEMYHFGKFTVGTTLSANLFKVTDTIVINFWLGSASLAVYSVGQRLIEIIEIPLRSFVGTGMPDLATEQNIGSKQQVLRIMKKYAGVLTISFIPLSIAALILADVGILIIGGNKYHETEAANIFRLLMVFALLYPTERFFALTIDAVHLPKINFIKVLIMVTANVIFNIIGVLILGNIYGVAIATLFPVLIGLGMGYWALNKYYQAFSFVSIYVYGWQTIKFYLQKRFKHYF